MLKNKERKVLSMIKGINLQLFAKAAKGFKIRGIFPVTKNDGTGYTVGAKIAITGAQSFTASPEVTEWKINADNGIYASGSDWNGIKATLTLAECPLTLRQYFEGGTYNGTTFVYSFASDDQAPEIGMSFEALQADNTRLMVKLFSMKATSFKMDFKTKGESGDISPVTIEFLIQNKVIDNLVKEEKETVTDADLTWLDTLA
jgi:phi13 family phage major tail protein